MSSVALVFDLDQTCHDDHYRRTVNAVNRNPVIERIVTTASPIDLATVADVCDVDDFMEERPLFPATRSGSLAILTDDLILSLSHVFSLWDTSFARTCCHPIPLLRGD
jgi:hypothetical protein